MFFLRIFERGVPFFLQLQTLGVKGLRGVALFDRLIQCLLQRIYLRRGLQQCVFLHRMTVFVVRVFAGRRESHSVGHVVVHAARKLRDHLLHVRGNRRGHSLVALPHREILLAQRFECFLELQSFTVLLPVLVQE